MKETSTQPKFTDHIRSWVTSKANGGPLRTSRRPDPDLLPISSPRTTPSLQAHSIAKEPGLSHSKSNGKYANNNSSSKQNDPSGPSAPTSATATSSPGGHGDGGDPPLGTPPQASHQGPVVNGVEGDSSQQEAAQENIAVRFLLTVRQILLHSKVNWLLVFVPIGIIVQEVPGTTPAVIFTMNALAIIPLAGLLSYATESVARRLGDSLGALLNVTFGNAVELIIFIALAKNEIRIVQASLLGSILANLLLILGMSFFLGGLRFREQIYNSTVTQMSACLLSLSVISLVLPTAFHASFSDTKRADEQSLKISRGTSVILLLVYIVYLLFQLMSHAYMYESTPQHIIDQEATPGPVAGWLDTSSSDSSSSSDSDFSDSDRSRETVSKRVRRVMRGQRRRKSSVISVDTSDGIASGPTRTPSFGTADGSPTFDDPAQEESSSRPRRKFSGANVDGNEEDAAEDEKPHRHKRRHRHGLKKYRKRKHHRHHMSRHSESREAAGEQLIDENTVADPKDVPASPGEPRRIDFAVNDITPHNEATPEAAASRRPFIGFRGMSLLPITKSLAPAVFLPPHEKPPMAPVPSGPVPRVRYGIRRTNSLPDRLSQHYRPPGAMMPSQIPVTAGVSGPLATNIETHPDQLSRTSSVFLLLISTGLVAVCAEFMVDSINGLVETSPIGEIFIGLILLPLVANAAEHVTAVSVALKNKMDLAIGVAVGSSIQIALFITPLVVIIGWGMGKDMSLYFTLFETVCLFVSAFIVNFLVLDGRSNYLEGALLLATYVIISLVAFFYPNEAETSSWGS